MNKSTTDADNRRLICRLCSNKGSLISLFKGKSRTVRDFIRKIVEVTVGIKYEEDNYFDCICYSCVIETYNIHVFKIKSLKNEERLQALGPKITKKSDSAKKLSDIELPNYTELKPILSIWLHTKTSDSSESTDKSSNEGSSPVCVKSTADNSTQTRAPKSFNVSVSAAFKPIIPKVTIETQTNLIETINFGTQCNVTKKESSKRPRIKDRYIQCDLLKVKIETKEPKSLFDVYTQTIDLKTENNNEAIITRKCDRDKYSWVHKTLNNKIKNINSDKNKSKKLKYKLKQHKSPQNFDDLFEPLKIDKAAVELEFSIKKSLSDSTIDSNESKMVDSSCNSTEASDNAQSNESDDKLVSETLIKCSNEDDSKNIRLRRSLSSRSELKTPPLQVKETLPNIIKTTETKKSERIANKSLLNKCDERATSGLLKTVTSPKVIETGIPIEISSQPNTNRSEERKVESEYLCTKRKSYLKPETPLNNHLRMKETKSSLNIDSQKSQLNQTVERLTSEILKVNEPVYSPIVKETSSQLNKNRSDKNIEIKHGHPKKKSYLKTPTLSNNRLQMKETLPNITKPPLNIDSQKSQLNQSVERVTSGILKVLEPVTSPPVKETISQLNKNRLKDSKVGSDHIRSKKKLCKKPETSPNINRLRMKETLPNITKSPLNTDTQKSETILNKSRLSQCGKKATSGLLKITEPVTSLKVTETSSQQSKTRKVESANVRHTKKLNLKPEFKTSSPKNNHLQIKEALSSFTTDSRKSESISNKTQLNQSDERPTIGLLKVIESVASPILKETDSPIETSFQSNENSLLADPSVYNPLTVDCQKPDLLEVKVEQDSPNLINLDTSIVLKSSPASYDNEPSPNNDSPTSSSSGLLQKTGKVEYLRTCPECGRIIHTKHEMVEHRKSHMKCYLCKKRFTSIKKTKEHMNNDCVRKLDSTNPVITLMKIEHCQSLTNQYPNVLGQITQSPKKRRRNDDSEEKGSKKKIVFLPCTSSSK